MAGDKESEYLLPLIQKIPLQCVNGHDKIDINGHEKPAKPVI
jgi:hypothetical protein